MKNIRQPPIIHHCNQTEYIQRGASLVQMAFCLLWERIEEVARIEKLLNASNEK